MEIKAQDAFGEAVLAELNGLSKYSPISRREFSEVSWEGRVVYLGGAPIEDTEVALYLGADLAGPIALSQRLGQGSVTALGASQFEKTELEELRRTQRVIPLYDVSWEVALRTAAAELEGGSGVDVYLNLNLFELHYGLQVREFLTSIEIIGGVAKRLHLEASQGSTELAAACVKECILGWWT